MSDEQPKQTKSSKPRLAPVDDYPERPDSEAVQSEDYWKKVEDRSTVDQIPDYHKKHPRTEPDAGNDPQVAADLIHEALVKDTKD